MISIYLVRHGEVYNPKDIVYGRLPGFKLSSEGRREAILTGQHLVYEKFNPDVIYASPLLRTVQTAGIIGRFFPGVAIKKSRGLVEGNVGWEGRRKIELIKSGIWQQYLDYPSSIITGEGALGLQKRVYGWVTKIVKQNKFKRIIAVTHQDNIRSVTLKLEGRSLDDLNRIPCATASVTIVEIDRGMNLLGPVTYWEPNGFSERNV